MKNFWFLNFECLKRIFIVIEVSNFKKLFGNIVYEIFCGN